MAGGGRRGSDRGARHRSCRPGGHHVHPRGTSGRRNSRRPAGERRALPRQAAHARLQHRAGHPVPACGRPGDVQGCPDHQVTRSTCPGAGPNNGTSHPEPHLDVPAVAGPARRLHDQEHPVDGTDPGVGHPARELDQHRHRPTTASTGADRSPAAAARSCPGTRVNRRRSSTSPTSSRRTHLRPGVRQPAQGQRRPSLNLFGDESATNARALERPLLHAGQLLRQRRSQRAGLELDGGIQIQPCDRLADKHISFRNYGFHVNPDAPATSVTGDPRLDAATDHDFHGYTQQS